MLNGIIQLVSYNILTMFIWAFEFYREEAKKKVQYASSVYKCELCIIGFYTQQQVEEHFESAHRAVTTRFNHFIIINIVKDAELDYKLSL